MDEGELLCYHWHHSALFCRNHVKNKWWEIGKMLLRHWATYSRTFSLLSSPLNNLFTALATWPSSWPVWGNLSGPISCGIKWLRGGRGTQCSPVKCVRVYLLIYCACIWKRIYSFCRRSKTKTWLLALSLLDVRGDVWYSVAVWWPWEEIAQDQSAGQAPQSWKWEKPTSRRHCGTAGCTNAEAFLTLISNIMK